MGRHKSGKEGGVEYTRSVWEDLEGLQAVSSLCAENILHLDNSLPPSLFGLRVEKREEYGLALPNPCWSYIPVSFNGEKGHIGGYVLDIEQTMKDSPPWTRGELEYKAREEGRYFKDVPPGLEQLAQKAALEVKQLLAEKKQAAKK